MRRKRSTSCGSMAHGRRKVQVKHSTKPIGVADAKRWAKELENSTTADKYELRLLGNCKRGLPPQDGKLGLVDIPLPEVVNLEALRKQAAHSLDVYLTRRTRPRSLRPRVREIVIDALSNRLGAASTTGEPLTRGRLDTLLNSWIDEILLQAGCATTSTHSDQQRFRAVGSTPSNAATVDKSRDGRLPTCPRKTALLLVNDEAFAANPDSVLPNDESPLRLLVATAWYGQDLGGQPIF